MKRRWKQTAGFTLVELIVVIAILGILAGVAVPTYSGYVKKANRAADEVLLSEINMAFAAACIENYCDASSINQAAWDMDNMTVLSVENNEAHPIVASFGRYFGTAASEFKVIEDLRFDAVLHRFVEKTSNFEGEGVMEHMELTLKGITGYFATAIEQGMTGDNLKTFLTAGMNDDLKNGLGLNGMIDGYNAATTYTDAQLDEKLSEILGAEAYNAMTDAEKTKLKQTYQGNLGMMYFAEDAAGRSVGEVMTGVGNFIDIMLAGKFNTESVTFEQLEAYYLETASPTDRNTYNAADVARKQEIIEAFRINPEAISINDDVKYSGAQAAAMAEAAKTSGGNTAGITTLSSMYALAAGYFNSDYYNPETDGTRPSSYGDFESVNKAMENESFYTYIEEQGQADLEYYLGYMKSLSENPNVDLTKSDIFAGLNGQS